MSIAEKKKRKRKEWTDPFVVEVRKIREEHAAQFNYDLRAISEDFFQKQEQLEKEGWTFVTEPLRNTEE